MNNSIAFILNILLAFDALPQHHEPVDGNYTSNRKNEKCCKYYLAFLGTVLHSLVSAETTDRDLQQKSCYHQSDGNHKELSLQEVIIDAVGAIVHQHVIGGNVHPYSPDARRWKQQENRSTIQTFVRCFTTHYTDNIKLIMTN